jgi:hypothetical protein
MLSPGSSETSINNYQNTRCDIPENINFIASALEPQIAYSIYNSSTLRMEAAGSFEMSVYIYQNTAAHPRTH